MPAPSAPEPDQAHYHGRFAPTPSGPLHMGSLLTALASWLAARHAGGRWSLRIDDLDTPRCVPGASDRILRQLEAHGLTWDGVVVRQSGHIPLYREALDTLLATGAVYVCTCTRRDIARQGHRRAHALIYPGTCRDAQHTPADGGSLRLRLDRRDDAADFIDLWRGPQHCVPWRDIGDFVLRRADGIHGYQLACAVDESAMGITEVVRGADLLDSTFQQRLVMKALGSTPPAYRHGPLLTGADGRKLSKQNHAEPLDETRASTNLIEAMTALGIVPPPDAIGMPPPGLLAMARSAWSPATLELVGRGLPDDR